MSFKDLKNNRSTLLKNLETAIQSADKKGGYEDPNIWKPTLNKETETGYARVRFLPPPDGEEAPFVKILKNSLKGPSGKFYIENSRKSIGEADPFNEFLTRMYNSGVKGDEHMLKTALEARSQKVYYANVLVLEDPANRANEGEVKIYSFGQKIFEMIQLKNKPQFADEVPANAFDMWTGCDFVIKARKSDGNWVYDKSTWGEVSEIFPNDDSKKEAYWKKTHSLIKFLDPSNYKPYGELATKLLDTLGNTEVGSGVAVLSHAQVAKPAQQFAANVPSKAAPKPAMQEAVDDAEETLNNPPWEAPAAKANAKATVSADSDADFFDFDS